MLLKYEPDKGEYLGDMSTPNFEPSIHNTSLLTLAPVLHHHNNFIAPYFWLSLEEQALRALIVTKSDATLLRESVAPEAAEVDAGLWNPRMGAEEPQAKDGFGENIKDSVGNDLAVD